MVHLYAVTTGDSSGIGPEILLKAFRQGEIKHPIVVFGDFEVLEFYNDLLNYGVPLRKVPEPGEYQSGTLNVIDAGIMRRSDVTVGRLNQKSGRAARG